VGNIFEEPRMKKIIKLVDEISRASPFKDSKKEVERKQLWCMYLHNELGKIEGREEENALIADRIREITDLLK